MDNYTINTYEMKRDIVKYSEKICEGASKPQTKFTMNMIYGISKSKNIHLSAIAEALSEKINKREFVNRIIKECKSLRDKVYMYFYQLSRGIYNILKMARTGIKDWQHIRKTKEYDGQLSLL